jgi:hypothetical protein
MSVAPALDALSRLQQRHALLCFVLFGGLLFLVDRLRQPAPLLIPPEAIEQGAAPQWLEDEVLYREALARGLGEGDLIVRRRLIQKMRQLLETGVDLAAPDEAVLAAWIEAHPARYGGLERIDFDHLFLSRARHGAALTAEAQRLGAQLKAEPNLDWAAFGDPHPAGTGVEGASGRDLERLFGSALASELGALPAGDWQPPLISAQGAHLVRIRQRELRPPDVAAVAQRAQRDWLIEQRRAQTDAAIQDLLSRYRVSSP